MHRRQGSATLSQLAFPGEGNPNFPWKKSHGDNTVLKSQKVHQIMRHSHAYNTGRISNYTTPHHTITASIYQIILPHYGKYIKSCHISSHDDKNNIKSYQIIRVSLSSHITLLWQVHQIISHLSLLLQQVYQITLHIITYKTYHIHDHIIFLEVILRYFIGKK